MFFLSYRRDDSKEPTGRIYDALERAFKARNVFRDLDSLEYGTAFPDGLRRGLERSDVVLTLIGPKWLEILRQREASGGVDFVREEIRLAIESGKHVLPLLVDGAAAPDAADLAAFPDIQRLASLQGLKVGPEPTFRADLRVLEQHLRPFARRRAMRQWRRRAFAGVLGLAVLGWGGWGILASMADTAPAISTSMHSIAVGDNAMTIPVKLVYSAKSGDKFSAIPIQSSVREESTYRLPDDLVPARDAFANEQAQRHAEQLDSVWNGRLYRLTSWNLLAPARERDPFSLALRLEPGDYYDFVVTHVKLKSIEVTDADGKKVSAWAKYVDSYPPDEDQPNPALSNYLGVSLTVVTEDGYVILHRRSGRNAIVPDYMHVSVAEGMSCPADGAEEPASLAYRTALRGLQEELCLTDMRAQDVKFLALVYSPDLAQFDLSGFVSLSMSRDEIEATIRGCRDQIFENERLQFEPFNGRSIAQAMRDEPRWSPFAVSSLLLALYHQYGMTQIDQDFAAIFEEQPVELKDFTFVPK